MPDDAQIDPNETIIALRRELTALAAERDEALAQQAAISEIVQIINRSPGELAPVFDAILEKAHTLCGAEYGGLATYDGEYFRLIAVHGYPGHIAETLRPPFQGNFSHQQLLRGDRYVHIEDTLALPQLTDLAGRATQGGGFRTILMVPLRKDGVLLGHISASRQEVRPFSDKQIALLENFAAQAVIAIENARLLTETREALEQQTATAEVLVINSSLGDLAPVFDNILNKTHNLCGASRAALFLFDGETFHAAAVHGYPEDFAEQLSNGISGPIFAPLIAGARLIHFPDLTQIDDPLARSVAERGGVRTNLLLPLRKDSTLLGMISCNRGEVRPFSDKEIALLENFAAQAVIAIENARLLSETREALEQQTATAEVLQVINSSPGDLAPVFDAMLEKAMRLCDGSFGELRTYDGKRFRLAATYGVPTAYVQHYARGDRGIYGPGTGPARILASERVVHIPDLVATEPYQRGDPDRVALVELRGARAYVLVPLLKDTTVLGYIMIYRKEVGSFSDKQIALLQNFAAQAVIAMENARLLTETREALEQQTATAEVLQVINSSPGDLAPVFDAMLEKAMRLCQATGGALRSYDGDAFHAVAMRGMSTEFLEATRKVRASPDSGLGRIERGEYVVQIADFTDTSHPRAGTESWRWMTELGGIRTSLWVALRKEATLLGTFVLYRKEVRPFSEKEVSLVQNFAAQAVIAMENARLLTETREALEQQTATAEVLQVINRSPGDLTPVFEAVLDKATSLCDAAFGILWTYDGERFYPVALHRLPKAFADFLREYQSAGVVSRPGAAGLGAMLRGDAFVHVLDAAEGELYRSRGSPISIAFVELGGARSGLIVPLRKDGTLLGAIRLFRQEMRPFSNKQIALLQNFAAQAVIAMHNARLLNEIRQRQAELRVTFDNMGDRVAMFDAELRLAAWNRNFQDMLDLPDSLLAERPSFAEYFRYLAERGEYSSAELEAELSRAVEDTGRDMRLERTRPDGRIIEVRRNAVPGGGFVLIYSDVTERNRAEAEVRAARDTAQRALGELQTAQASLLHAQKMAALGQLTAGIAHEIKNPLNFVNNFAELSGELLQELRETTAPVAAALDDDTRAEVDEIVDMLTGNLAKIAEHGKRADGIVQSMLAHSRGTSGERQRIDINALVEEALNLAYHGARAQDQNFNIILERDFDSKVAPLEVVPQDVLRVFLNLIGNGFYAAIKRAKDASDPAFKPSLKVITRDLGAEVEVRVRDNGTGIAPEARDKLFQPFFTTKPTGEGTGLGLSISWDIITQQHGGMITVDSEVGAFTEFTICLPQRPPGAAGRVA